MQTISKPELRFPVISWNLCWDREELKRRIAERTEIMLEAGWIEEARDAIKAGILNTPTAHQVLGYRVIGEYMDNKIDYGTMRERIITNTWQLARRQITWFKKQHPETENIQMPVDYEYLREHFNKELTC
jgi:tRNA dimethylallyltransferase